MGFKEYIQKKRDRYENSKDKIAYRCLGPLKLFLLIAVTMFILSFFYQTCEMEWHGGPIQVCNSLAMFSDPTALTIIYIVLFVGIFWAFDFLFVLIYYWISK